MKSETKLGIFTRNKIRDIYYIRTRLIWVLTLLFRRVFRHAHVQFEHQICRRVRLAD